MGLKIWSKPLVRPEDVFTRQELEGIKKAVADAESQTSGEIRVMVRSNCEGKLSTHDQTLQDFYYFGLDKTRGQTGILILIVLAKRKVEVLADKGINEKVPQGYWDSVVKMVTDGFSQGKPYEGVCQAVAEVGRLLQEKFPRRPDDTNELPNEVIQKS